MSSESSEDEFDCSRISCDSEVSIGGADVDMGDYSPHAAVTASISAGGLIGFGVGAAATGICSFNAGCVGMGVGIAVGSIPGFSFAAYKKGFFSDACARKDDSNEITNDSNAITPNERTRLEY